jgi:hypothetical protein
MKVFNKVIVLLIAIQMICLASFRQTAIYAGHQGPVLSTVNSARLQGVPEEVLIRLLAYALENQIGRDHTVHMLTILIRVHEGQFPLSPFLDKIQEGMVKQIDPQRLVDGLNKHLDDCQFVRQLLEKKYTGSRVYSENDFTVLVDSLKFGNTRQELRDLFNRAPAAPLAMLSVAAKNKALLRQLEFDDRTIDAIMFTGLKNHSLTPRWSLFFKVAAAAKQKGIPTARIAEVTKAVLAQNGDPVQVLKELEFTFRDVRHGPHLDSPPDADEVNQ